MILNKLAAVSGVAALAGAVWLGLSLSQAPLTAIDLDRGAHIFEKRCATCHASELGQLSLYGPNLVEIGAVAGTRVPRLSAEAYLLESIIDPNAYRNAGEHGVMPADVSGGLDAIELTSLVGFLMKQGGSVNWPRLVALTRHATAPTSEAVEQISLEDVEAGKKIYLSKANCQRCHPLQVTPGATLRAPSLLLSGRHSAQYLRESIRHPSKSLVAGYSNWTVWLADGRATSGRLVRSTESEIELLVKTKGALRPISIRREECLDDENGNAMLRQMPNSAMPDNLTNNLTERELDQLVAFLKTLR
ncbi:MAG: c-type cytochrome [Planctomycetes bacterium]|nr:c-type cytochrome [Planctomycetota bacterium]